jgi:hypothetical protein
VTKTMNVKSAKIAMCKISIGSEPLDQVLIGGLLFSLIVHSLVCNLLAKRTHDCKSVSVLVGVSFARTIVFFLSKELGS